MPHGALGFLVTTRPVAGVDGAVERKPLSRFVLNQDTGGAIRSPGRVDVFWGRGPEAELSAGHMKDRGRMFYLVKKRATAETSPATR
jgi:membrane-bound lytic murein transglycosylase A